VTITRLRRDLFDLVDRASRGEPIIIVRNGTEVARLLPAGHPDWRGA
jgi:prevent-host-death family protein